MVVFTELGGKTLVCRISSLFSSLPGLRNDSVSAISQEVGQCVTFLKVLA